MSVKLTDQEKEDLASQLAEGFHTAFRKGTDSPRAHPIWKAIKELPPDEWGEIIDFVMYGITPYLEGNLLLDVVKRESVAPTEGCVCPTCKVLLKLNLSHRITTLGTQKK
jgi:hypothetical protein